MQFLALCSSDECSLVDNFLQSILCDMHNQLSNDNHQMYHMMCDRLFEKESVLAAHWNDIVGVKRTVQT